MPRIVQIAEAASASHDFFFDVFFEIEPAQEVDLQIAAVAVAKHDKNITAVKISDEDVSVDYKIRARLLCFILFELPMTFTDTDATQEGNFGRIKIKIS